MFKQEKKRLVLVISLVLIILLTLLMVYFVQDFVKNSSIEPLSYHPSSEVSLVDSLKEIFISSPKIKFQDLIRSDNVVTEPLGRSSTSRAQSDENTNSPSEMVAGLKALPVVDSLILNATTASNYTTDNLTAHVTTSDGDLDDVKVIYNWYKDSDSITVLNMPFENNSFATTTAKDYSGFGNNGTIIGATWNVTGGYDGKGAYEFDGTDDYINVSFSGEVSSYSYWGKNQTGAWHFYAHSNGISYVDGEASSFTSYIIYSNNNYVRIGLGYPEPDDVDGLVLWLVADDLSGGDGTQISSWNDRSPGNHDATQWTSSSYRPLLYNNKINGHKTVKFDGSNDYLNVGTIRDAQGDYTVFFVSKRESATGDYWQRMLSSWDGYCANDYTCASWTIYHSHEFTNHAGAPQVYDTYIKTERYGSDAREIDNVVIGADAHYTSGSNYRGYVAEVVLYDNYISDDEYNKISAYLEDKYVLDLAARYFNGTIDDVQVYNRALTADQIYALYQNRTDEIVAAETSLHENWTVIAYPNDGKEDGVGILSNNITIFGLPQVSGLIPDSGSSFNVSTIIEIGANVTADLGVNTVLANVTYPNGTINQLPLTNVVDDKYNVSFTTPVLGGSYTVRIIANDTYNGISSEETTFTVHEFPDCDTDTVTGIFSVTSSTSVSTDQTCRTITVNSGATLTIDNNPSLGVPITLNAENITVIGVISANSQGSASSSGTGQGTDGNSYNGAGGGAYGGNGGSGQSGRSGGTAYGSITQPNDLGSGGGGIDGTSGGGAGGGAIKINATDTLTVNGSITANGGNGGTTCNYRAGGGGSGGSVWLITNVLSGTGSITTNGANGGNCYYADGGAGGAGRIAVYYESSTFIGNGTIQNKGGSFNYDGGAGSVYLKSSSQTLGDVIYDNGGLTSNAGTPVNGQLVFDNVIVTNGADLRSVSLIDLTQELLVNNSGRILSNVNITAPNVTILSTASISANSQGSASSSGTGQGTDGNSYNGAGGGGYGGNGGSGESGRAGGSAYGSITQPNNLGSGGGGYNGASGGGAGGGAIKINATGTLTINGSITSNGGTGGTSGAYYYAAGGGSGGSVWLITNVLSGTGSITANGGNGGDAVYADGGGGGGGRISSMCNVPFLGSMTANGGTFYNHGSVGTTYLTCHVQEITLNSPADELVINTTSVLLNTTVIDDDDDNMTVYFLGDGNHLNVSYNVTNGTDLTFNFSGLSEGLHNWSVIAEVEFNVTETQTFTVDLSNPDVTDLIPVSDTRFNVSDTIEIGANITDVSQVSYATATVTYPNGAAQTLVLTNAEGDKYNSSFTVPNVKGRYDIAFFANDTVNHISNSEATNFNVTNRAPIISNVILNSSDGTNLTVENFTANVDVSDEDGDSVKLTYNWYRNDASITVLNMPFEKINNTDSNNAHDYSGYANDGTVSGATWNSTGGYDSKGAYEFDGSTGKLIDLNDPLSLNFGSNPFTLSAWIKQKDHSGTYYIIGKYEPTGDQRSWLLWTDSNAALAFYTIQGTGAQDTTTTDSSVLTANVWQHVVVVKEGTGVDFYINGALVNDDDVAVDASIFDSSGDLTIGSWGDGSSGVFNGTIDEIMVFNRTLSADQIYALYQNRTDLIVSAETEIGDDWAVAVYPNDGFVDGVSVKSNNITISGDPSPPVVYLLSPANNTATNSPSITFVYNVSDADSGITSCSLIRNEVIKQTDNSITEDVNQSFSVVWLNDTYDWSVDCTDDSESLNVGSSETRNLSVTAQMQQVSETLTPSSVSVNGNVVVSGKVNFTDGTNVVNGSVNIYLNGTLQTNSYGDGSDGALTVSSANTVVNNYTYLTDNETVGNITITVNDASAFSAGDELLIIQMQNFSAGITGQYEFVDIVSKNGNDITLASALNYSYYSGTFNTARATSTQVIRVPQYTSVTVGSSTSITASTWDGYSGGIVILRATEIVDVIGNLNVIGKGYRGSTGVGWWNVNAGESINGLGLGRLFTYNIGGGADGGASGAAGGGGGGGFANGPGGEGNGNSNGNPGSVGGEQTLSRIYFGSGGGGGAGGDTSSLGGNGGGIIFISAKQINVSGDISGKGTTGGSAIGSWSSGGGGGAGGAIYLVASNMTLGSNLIYSPGSSGGTGSSFNGGAGSEGRIRLDYNTLSGTTNPSAYTSSIVDSGLKTNASGYYTYNLTAPSTAGTYPIKVNVTYQGYYGENTKDLTVQAAFSAPTQTENNVTDGEGIGQGTNLDNRDATTIQSVSDYKWHRKGKGKITWKSALDFSNVNIGGDNNLDNDIEVGTRFVSVNSATASAFASKSANVTFENVDCSLCNSKDILYSSSYYTSLSEIQGNGISCSLADKCSSISCTNPGSTGNCTFTASSFSGYALGGNANLTINDSVEGSSALTDTEVSFYAKYLNVTDNSPIHSATCNITFDDAPGTWYDMTWNGTGTNLYNFTKTAGFASANTHTWNVTCSKTGFTTLLANDTIEIQSLASSSGGTSNQTGKVNFTQAGSAGIILQDDGIAFGSGYFNTTCSQSYSVLDSASLFNAGQNGAYASPGCWINTTALNVYDEGVDSAQDYHWIENNGTTIVSISASADKDGPDFICGRLEGGVCVTASANFSVKAAANETSACGQGLNSTYQPMGADGINNTVPLCAMLHFADTKDDLKIYYKISIPSDIMPGFKTMAITYIATAL